MKRNDDYEQRRGPLRQLSDKELEQRFWSLAEQLTEPMLKMGYENTTPAIERSVLLRMGFSSLEAKAIVDGCMERGLRGHGAGHVVYRLARDGGMDVRGAGLALAEGRLWDEAAKPFLGGKKA